MAQRQTSRPDDTDVLLRDAARGDEAAVRRLLDRYRERLRRMVSLRLDSRVSARVDASDVVQEALIDAAQKLADYERDRPIPFYPWLHRLAADKLALAHRHHLRAGRRSVAREEADTFVWLEGPSRLLVDWLVASDATPGAAFLRSERQSQVHAALERLAPADRDVLIMRYLEDLSFPEIAAVLGIGESAAKMRHLRAIEKMRAVLDDGDKRQAP
jgi:RNA polymerase sigma-70 factor, ECF subfamily